MHLQTVRLQRVFGVKRDAISKREATNFSFETDEGRRCLSVQLPGRPRLEVGDTVTVVLGRQDNWQTLRAWKNLADGQIIVRGCSGVAGWLRTLCVSGVAWTLWRGATTDNGRVMSGLFLGMCGLMAVVQAQAQWQTWQAQRLLARP